MKREELYRDKNECGTIVYNAAEADSVMDAMEKRIKDFEVNHKLWEAENDALRNRIKELEKGLREWKAQCLELKYPCDEKESGESTFETTEEKEDVMKPLNDNEKELNKPKKKFRRMTFKEVKDWLEQGNGQYKITGDVQFIYYDATKTVDDNVLIRGWSEPDWHDYNLEIYGITHWLDNAFPPPPTTEEK